MANGAILGPRASVDALAQTLGLDAGIIFNNQLSNMAGLTVEGLVSRAAAAIGAANEQIAAEWARLWYITTMPFAFDMAGVGGTRETPEKAEFKGPDPVHGDFMGHMIPATYKADALGWTSEWMDNAYEEMVVADLGIITTSWRNKVERDFFRRLFDNTFRLIGTSGYAVPFPNGETTPFERIPPSFGAYNFDALHDHFLATADLLATAADAKAHLELAISHLTHHGINGADGSRFVLLISEPDIGDWMALDGIVRVIPEGITVVGGSASAPVFVTSGQLTGAPGQVLGLYVSQQGPVVEIRASARIPENYAWLGKAFGNNNPNNPIAVRVHRKYGFGLRVKPRVVFNPNPEIEMVHFEAFHGMGVGSWLNGVGLQFGNAAYEAPEIG